MTIHQRIERILKIVGIVGAILIVLFIGLIVLANIVASPGTHTTAPVATATSIPTVVPTHKPAPTPTPTVDVSTLPAYQLAAIDSADTSDPTVIVQYQSVLDSLHNKTGESETNIANATYTAQGILTKDGYQGTDDTMLGLMQDVDSAITKSEHMKYNEALAALITLMANPS